MNVQVRTHLRCKSPHRTCRTALQGHISIEFFCQQRWWIKKCFGLTNVFSPKNSEDPWDWYICLYKWLIVFNLKLVGQTYPTFILWDRPDFRNVHRGNNKSGEYFLEARLRTLSDPMLYNFETSIETMWREDLWRILFQEEVKPFCCFWIKLPKDLTFPKKATNISLSLPKIKWYHFLHARSIFASYSKSKKKPWPPKNIYY